ncbi:MAG: hypothetical protein HY268_05750 [Deltaproteobacteria bacterium]|nr:hypothetical protein [Deltaproteobacteria bacterium]
MASESVDIVGYNRAQEIEQFSCANIQSYIVARDRGGTYWWRSIESLSGQVAQEYQGRVLYELIQNASDAHKRAGSTAAVLIRFDRSEGRHGTLYVINGGCPFTRADFEAVNSIAQSSKPPGEGIGNKGLGFRSYLTICDWPEIYSADPEPLRRNGLNGYSFGFARDDDLVRLCDGDSELASAIRQGFPRMLLPTPRFPVPEAVCRLAGEGTATVVRLPLRSQEATSAVEAQIQALQSTDAPLLLFLDWVKQLTVEIIRDGAVELQAKLTREAKPLDMVSARGLTFEIVDLRKQGQLLLVSKAVSVSDLREQIEASIAMGSMNERWREWNEDSRISVACHLDGDIEKSRLYTFLPMREEAPFAGYLNAPFFTDLGRLGLDLQIPFNRFLIETTADLCAAGALDLTTSKLDFAGRCAIDLVTWNSAQHDEIEQAFNRIGVPLLDADVIPARGPEAKTWAAIRSARRWNRQFGCVDAERLVHAAGALLVPPDLGERRIERLHRFLQNWRADGLDPDWVEKANWFERAAVDLSKEQASIILWEKYYDDLASEFTRNPNVLVGRLIILEKDGTCVQAGMPISSDSIGQRISVFFAPTTEDEDDEVDEEEIARISDLSIPPSALNDRVRFMHPGLTWNQREGRTISKLQRRRFLEDARLVRVFRRREVLEILGAALAESTDGTFHQEGIRWAYDLYRTSRSNSKLRLREIPFRLPCRGGFQLASLALFSSAWGTPDAGELEAFLDDAALYSDDFARCRDNMLLSPGQWPFDISDIPSFREFLYATGVRDGLWPEVIHQGPVRMLGGQFHDGSFRRSLKLTKTDSELWWTTIEETAKRPANSAAQCILDGPIVRLPGQTDYTRLPESARRTFAALIGRGLGRWKDTNFEVTVRRVYGGEMPVSWPNLLSVFLKRTPWVPVTRVGDRNVVDFVTPSEAWHCSLRSADLPTFSPYIHHSIRVILEDSNAALQHFRRLGGHDWLHSDDAPALIRHLTTLCRDPGIQDGHRADFLAAYEEAWRKCLSPEIRSPFSPSNGPPQVVAQIRDHLVVVPDLSDVESPLYVDTGVDPMRAMVIGALDRPVLHISPERFEDQQVTEQREIKLAKLLADILPMEVQRLSAVAAEVVADGAIIHAGTGIGRRLIESDTEGLVAVVILLLALDWSGGTRSRRLGEAETTLRRIRLLVADQVAIRIDGQDIELPPALGGVLTIDHTELPVIIVRRQSDESMANIVPRLAYPLAAMLKAKAHADALAWVLSQVSAVTLEQGLTGHTNSELAALFRASPTRIREIAKAFHSRRRHLIYLLRPVLVYWGLTRASEVLAVIDEDAANDLSGVLQPFAKDLLRPIDELLDACRHADSPWHLRDLLALDFAAFNKALIALAFMTWGVATTDEKGEVEG